MAQRVMFLTLVATLFSGAIGSSIRGQNFLGASMQPEVVAKTLLAVEDEWKAQAENFLECNLTKEEKGTTEDCDMAPNSFFESCEKVVDAIVKGSNGETQVTKEYMIDVCSQPAMTLWRRDSCITLAKDVAGTMTASAYDNRVNFKAKDACDEFWSNFVKAQTFMHQKELDAMKEEAAQEKKKDAEEKDAEELKKWKEEAEKRTIEEVAQKKAAAKNAKLEALRKKLKMNDSLKADESVEEQKATVEAVDEAAEAKLKEAADVEVGTNDTVKPSNETPDMQRAYAVLKAADAMTTENAAPHSEKKVSETSPTSNSTKASAAPANSTDTKKKA